MDASKETEEPIFRVTLRSSTKNRPEVTSSQKIKRGKRGRSRKKIVSDPESSDGSSGKDSLKTRPRAEVGSGVDPHRIPEDISREVRRELTGSGQPTVRATVTFDDTPVVIPAFPHVDEYDIIEDIKSQKANVTIGQLLHDNINYQKVIRDAWRKRRTKRTKLPSVATNFLQAEDQGAPEVTVVVEGCTIPHVPVDGGSGVNLMLEDTAFDLGYTTFEATTQVLRMADQSRVLPIGRLSQVPTVIGEVTYLLNYVIIRVTSGRPFPMLLGRPWLYMAGVLVDWGAQEFVLGKDRKRIPWKLDSYQGETSESDGYTTDWSDPEEEDEALSYFVQPFFGSTETDFEFPLPVKEIVESEDDQDGKAEVGAGLDDRSLGEISVPLTNEWIQEQLRDGKLPPVGIKTEGTGLPWSAFRHDGEEHHPDPIKNIVSPADYEKVEVEPGRTFLMRKSMSPTERAGYVALLREYTDVFAWSPDDLQGIPPELGLHHIDLLDGSTPVRQRQYRLNPKYSLMVKEEIDSLLKAGFIYPVCNSEWV